MPHQFDVVVLGAGVTGCAAALAAAQAGARVGVITAEPGASALFSGAWRGTCPPAFQTALERAGHKLVECNEPLPHPNGSVVDTTLASASHSSALLREDVLVCGVGGLPSFHARSLSALWGARAGVELLHATITLDATPRTGWAPASLAAFLERESGTLTKPLQALVEQQRASRVILPAVLGLEQHGALYDRVTNEVGCAVGEALATTPSLPGWRLHNALRRALADAKVEILQGRARLRTHGNNTVDDVDIPNDVVRAKAFVLATGKYLSGGIEANGTFSEPVFGLPVWVEHLTEIFDSPEPLNLTHQELRGSQPLLEAGLHADAENRPVDAAGDVVFNNVFVAGSIRSGWSTANGTGDCAQDGWRAGERAVKA